MTRIQKVSSHEWVAFTSEGHCSILKACGGGSYLLLTPWGQEEFTSLRAAKSALREHIADWESSE